MSDIAVNSSRYGPSNTRRSDAPKPHNGQVVAKDVIGFDCSGFVCHVIIESGYRINYESTHELSKSQAFSTIPADATQPGDIVLFDGHVGIVLEYNAKTYLGNFRHMRGRNNEGEITNSYFVLDERRYKKIANQPVGEDPTGPDNKIIIYGTSRPVKAIRRVKSSRYTAELDLHKNGSNPYPILQPLGTQIYSKHRLRTAQDQKRIIESRNSLPSPRPLKRKAIPHRVGYTTLLDRLWGKLTEGNLADYE